MITRRVKSRAEFDAGLAEQHLRGQWRTDERLNANPGDGPRPMGVPYLWKWTTVRAALAEAAEVLADSLRQRRSVLFANPGLESGGTTHTFGVGVQLVTPGELAWAHRHTMAAIRFGIEGDTKLVTVVDGRSVAMEPGDLILTPNWSWHDHYNGGKRDGIWLDAIDSPLVGALGQRWYQPFGERRQGLDPQEPESAYRFPWRAMLERIEDAPETPHDGKYVTYDDPRGRPVLPTLGCAITSLRPRFETRPHRHTSSTVYFVVRGEGTTYAGDQVMRWSERDTFVIPNWTTHRHVNDSVTDAILFSITDEPLLRAIDLYREESQE